MDATTLFIGAATMIVVGLCLLATPDRKAGTSYVAVGLGLMWMGVATVPSV